MALSEDDTRVKLIDPKIKDCGWIEDYILRQYQITDDRFIVEGEDFKRISTKLFTDYVLKYKETIVTVLEAKAEDEDPEKYLSQVEEYAKKLDVPIAYITNGKRIFSYDRRNTQVKEVDSFLSPEDIYKIYIEFKNLHNVKTDPLNYPNYYSALKKPRAYQEVATRCILENIVKGKKNTLLTMATGTGKTFVAFQTIWKLIKSKYISNVLFLTDRIFLRDQAHDNEFEPFRQGSRDDRYIIKNGQFNKNRSVYFSNYQTLYANDLYKAIPEDFFDLIVIDECHRSRYGDWGIILDHFNKAYHLGMTATPKREDNIDVYEYFGEPVYQYSLGEAIEDGYLVPYKIYKINTNLYLQGGVHINEAEEIIYDDEVEPDAIKEFYDSSQFEREITLPDQIDLLSTKVVEVLDKTEPYAKTIVFCVDIVHAQQVKDSLNKIKNDENYCTRIVSEDKDDMSKFKDREMPKPIIATTVDLLSTGIDIPQLKNIVFMRAINSQVLFKQIIGRGSRLSDGKGFFRIIDFTDASRLLDSWDKPTQQPPDPLKEPIPPFDKLVFGRVIDDETSMPINQAQIILKVGRWTKAGITYENGYFKIFGIPSNDLINLIIKKDNYRDSYNRIKPQKDESDSSYNFTLKPEKIRLKKLKLLGIDVTIAEETEIEFDGNKLSYAEYRKYARKNLIEITHSTEELRKIWLNQYEKENFIKELQKKRINLNFIKSMDMMDESDSFDIIAHIAFDAPLLTREDRTKFFIREYSNLINQYGREIKNIIFEVLDKYKFCGENNLSAQIFLLPNMFLKKQTIQSEYPGGIAGFLKLLKERIYNLDIFKNLSTNN